MTRFQNFDCMTKVILRILQITQVLNTFLRSVSLHLVQYNLRKKTLMTLIILRYLAL